MLVTVKQAEKITGYSYNSLMQRIRTGDIPTVKHGKFHMIEEKDLAPFMKKTKNSEHVNHVESGSLQGIPFLNKRLPLVALQKKVTKRSVKPTSLTATICS